MGKVGLDGRRQHWETGTHQMQSAQRNETKSSQMGVGPELIWYYP